MGEVAAGPFVPVASCALEVGHVLHRNGVVAVASSFYHIDRRPVLRQSLPGGCVAVSLAVGAGARALDRASEGKGQALVGGALRRAVVVPS